jgi:plastocyanin
MRKVLLATIVLLGVVFLAHTTLPASAKPPDAGANGQTVYTITIKNFMFSSPDLHVPVGSKVTWLNQDEEPHTVVEINRAFSSNALDTNEGFTYQFKRAGTYKFFCTLHPRMTGTITVEAK